MTVSEGERPRFLRLEWLLRGGQVHSEVNPGPAPLPTKQTAAAGERVAYGRRQNAAHTSRIWSRKKVASRALSRGPQRSQDVTARLAHK